VKAHRKKLSMVMSTLVVLTTRVIALYLAGNVRLIGIPVF
jgi:hypothetical protein